MEYKLTENITLTTGTDATRPEVCVKVNTSNGQTIGILAGREQIVKLRDDLKRLTYEPVDPLPASTVTEIKFLSQVKPREDHELTRRLQHLLKEMIWAYGLKERNGLPEIKDSSKKPETLLQRIKDA